MSKRCRKCGQIKLLNEFTTDRTKRDGHQSLCKQCVKEGGFRYIPSTKPKICSLCSTEKPASEFSSLTHVKDGLNSRCKLCCAANMRQRRSKIKPAADKAAKTKYRYGITIEQYNEMLEQQQGLCAVCERPETRRDGWNRESTRALGVDHSHKTGKVRGLLCGNCNTAIAFLDDNVLLLQRIADYLEGKLPLQQLRVEDCVSVLVN